MAEREHYLPIRNGEPINLEAYPAGELNDDYWNERRLFICWPVSGDDITRLVRGAA